MNARPLVQFRSFSVTRLLKVQIVSEAPLSSVAIALLPDFPKMLLCESYSTRIMAGQDTKKLLIVTLVLIFTTENPLPIALGLL